MKLAASISRRGALGLLRRPKATYTEMFTYTVEQEDGLAMVYGYLVGLFCFAGIFSLVGVFPESSTWSELNRSLPWFPMLFLFWVLWKAHKRWGFGHIRKQLRQRAICFP
jgi:hypothetical protein